MTHVDVDMSRMQEGRFDEILATGIYSFKDFTPQ